MMVYCPYCGCGHKITRREMMYIDLHGSCSRECMSCKQTYYFSNNGSIKQRRREAIHLS